MAQRQMGPFLWLIICVTTLVAGMPQRKKGDDRAGLDRPSTSPTPEITEGHLSELIDEIFEVNKDCECVPYYLCDDNNAHASFNKSCKHFLETCCARSNIRDPEKPAPRNKCGIRNVDGVGIRFRRDVDSEAQYGEFPWMVAVVQSDTSQSTPDHVYQCGGSLIHPQVVLTGGHCVRSKNNLLITAGEWDTQTKQEIYPSQDVRVREVIIHEQFNNNTLANNPALLILEAPVDMSLENVGLICLPEENEIMDGRDCVTSGWGNKQFGNSSSEIKYQAILQKVDMPIVSREPCLEALRRTRLSNYFELHPSFICAGGIPGTGTCKGDGGSPLVCPRKNDPGVYVQAGIVAWNIDCGTETPEVYVNVPAFVPWINKQLQQRGIFKYDGPQEKGHDLPKGPALPKGPDPSNVNINIYVSIKNTPDS